MLILIIMNIRNRITQFLWTLVANIKCSKGNILLGRVTGAGPAQELTIGSGLQITGTTLSATGGGGTGTISPSDIPGLSTPGDGTGLHELHLNSAGGVCGLLNLWSDSGFKAQIYAPLSYTANRTIELPDADGTLALTTDITPYTTIPGSQLGVPVINFAEKGLLYAELTGNTTITFQNLAPGIVKDVLIWQSSGWGINWPAGIKWVPGSVIPTSVYPVYIRFFSTTSAASGVIAIVLSRNA